MVDENPTHSIFCDCVHVIWYILRLIGSLKTEATTIDNNRFIPFLVLNILKLVLLWIWIINFTEINRFGTKILIIIHLTIYPMKYTINCLHFIVNKVNKVSSVWNTHNWCIGQTKFTARENKFRPRETNLFHLASFKILNQFYRFQIRLSEDK